jgi:flagellar biosynthesis protein FlhF
MMEAMRRVREELGPAAIILSTREEANAVFVTAAAEPERAAPPPRAPQTADILARALAYHGVPQDAAARILRALPANDTGTEASALATALDATYGFAPIPAQGLGRPILMVGPPGAGKSTTAAKLAARAHLAGVEVSLANADGQRSQAGEALAAFANILDIPLIEVETPEKLVRARTSRLLGPNTIIDTPGFNPFAAADLAQLNELALAADAEPVLVLPAGLDPVEAGEITEALALVAPSRMITTRLDMARRLGSVIAAAEAAGLKFADAGISPRIAGGLESLSAPLLARLIMRDPLAVAELPKAEATQ